MKLISIQLLRGMAIFGIAWGLMPSLAKADVYRCKHKDGEITYQSQPCEDDTGQTVVEELKGNELWRKITSWEWGNIYYDPARHWRAGNHVMLWLLYNRSDSASNRFIAEPYGSIVVNESIDCDKHTTNLLSYAVYEKQFANGKLLRKDGNDGTKIIRLKIDEAAAARVYDSFCQKPNRRGYSSSNYYRENGTVDEYYEPGSSTESNQSGKRRRR